MYNFNVYTLLPDVSIQNFEPRQLNVYAKYNTSRDLNGCVAGKFEFLFNLVGVKDISRVFSDTL